MNAPRRSKMSAKDQIQPPFVFAVVILNDEKK